MIIIKISKKILLILIISSLFVISLRLSVFAGLTDSDVQAAVESGGKEAVSGNFFIWFLCAIAFLKISQKIDSFLSGLGLNVGHTGGSLLSEAMAAAKVFSGGKAFGGGFGSGNKNSGEPSFLQGGLAGAVGRKFNAAGVNAAVNKNAGPIGKKAFESSLNNNGDFSKGIIGEVAKGDIKKTGSITGDTAEKALNNYLGFEDAGSASVADSVADGYSVSSAGGGEYSSAGMESSEVVSDISSSGISSSYESSSMDSSTESSADSTSYTDSAEFSATEVVPESTSGIGSYSGDVSETSIVSSPSSSTSEGSSVSSAPVTSVPASSVLVSSSDAISTPQSSTVEKTTPSASGSSTVASTPIVTGASTAEATSTSHADTPTISIPADSSPPISSGITENQSVSQSSSADSSSVESVSQTVYGGSGASITSSATENRSENHSNPVTVPVTSNDNFSMTEMFENGSMLNTGVEIPSFSNVEIGGGRITGTEKNTDNPNGIDFAMYSVEQYLKPDGDFSIVKSVDGAKWYKQTAVDKVEKTPIVAENGTISYKEKVVKRMPSPPRRKDKV